MKTLLQRLLKIAAYLAATVVILLAIAVGIFRLMLPRLPEYQEQIKEWASEAIGMQVEFSDMNARWRLSGPELSFSNAMLRRVTDAAPLLAVAEVSVGVSLVRLLNDRELVADRILLRGTEVNAALADDGSWVVQGVPLADLFSGRAGVAGQAGNISVVAENIVVQYQHPSGLRILTFVVDSLEVQRDETLLAVNATVDPPDNFGERMKVAASQRQGQETSRPWQFFLEGNALNLVAWSALQPAGLPEIVSGTGNVSLWVQRSDDGVQSATANVSLNNLAARDAGPGFSASGRLEFTRVRDGWLVAGSEFSLDTARGDAWPKSNWQYQTGTTVDGVTQSFIMGASYLRLHDLDVLNPWLPEAWTAQLARVAPDGVLREFAFAQSGINSESPVFELSARFDSAGILPVDDWPGLRGFSGNLRADSAGGRLEIDSENLRVSLPAELSAPVHLDEATGTIIWRRNVDGIIVLSDSIHIRNTDLSSQTSLQVNAPADGGSAIIDLRSDWSVNDIGRVGSYLPMQAIKPPLYRWLTTALVSGRIPRATTRITGPLELFPFDGGEGIFRIDAEVERAVLRYAEQWPAATNMNLDIVVDGTRLYSHRNSAINAGNTVQDAKIEIADLRKPVLEIDAFATGTLQSIRDFSRNSPIAAVFGGQLDRLDVEGEASFNLRLTLPIADKQDFDFETRIRSSGGSIRVEGFPAPVTELNGLVVVTRDDVRSEMLFGRFLGETVDIELRKAGDDMPAYNVVATAIGTATAEAIVGELGMPLDGFIEGSMPFTATLLFPSRQEGESAPFRIVVESALQGFGVDLPAPFYKVPEEAAALTLGIGIAGGNRIESDGSYRDDLDWTLAFQKSDAGWDFDRGILTVGDVSPGVAETRGLHVHGQLDELRLADWLSLLDRGTGKAGVGERIRSIDLNIDRLDAIGQYLTAQHVVVNRSAQEWVVQLDGEHAIGTVTVPYDFSGERPLTLDMERLVLPGKEGTPEREPTTTDPRRLPRIALAAREFALGERYLGNVSALFEKTPLGIEARNVQARDKSFALDGRAGWFIDVQDAASGQRSEISVTLRSTDVRQTMQRLNYEPGLDGQDMEVKLDVHWSGGPQPDYLDTLNGEVSVRFGPGQLDEVEPGPGRVFGLMSIVALPRRLSLDFSDVFEKGFGFDEITGRFRIEDGNAFTCDLSLKGPAADVGIVGRAGLASRDYTQAAVVSANVGNTLPVVGAVVAGPQVAAVLLIFSQIFKKPLQEIGQVYYAIDGSWDEPSVESANALRFAETGALASCLEEAE
jgi:uncharacterized protein (TIGR02099 family)